MDKRLKEDERGLMNDNGGRQRLGDNGNKEQLRKSGHC